MYESGAPSAGTVAMSFGAVSGAGATLVTQSGAINGALESLDKALNPVRMTWYESGSSSGQEAQIAEVNLRKLLNDMTLIINNLGRLLDGTATEGAALDGALGQRFQGHGTIR
ncbi:MAG TPA: hypothetical protein VFV67_32170 [Actinophytocola sp.]|uniref:hypothetical protein n=1 Tax=Actinophytocola sp. TaxID=1872138 RepID=UPI002DB7C9B1|nr:hypothetical protein [Actinophytocola sp.]HEU5475323.1 hypothetical protein [Actinophytocola sp.]